MGETIVDWRTALEKLRSAKSMPLRDPSLGPREVKDKVLDALYRQRQAQINEQDKVRLQAAIAAYQRQQGAKAIHDGVNHLTTTTSSKIKRPPPTRYFGRTNL